MRLAEKIGLERVKVILQQLGGNFILFVKEL
jgi:hypothetical protein